MAEISFLRKSLLTRVRMWDSSSVFFLTSELLVFWSLFLSVRNWAWAGGGGGGERKDSSVS